MSEAAAWVTQQLAAAGFTALPSLRPGQYFETTGFAVEPSSAPSAARVTVTARFTGQDGYEQWGEAQALASELMDVLEPLGVGFEGLRGVSRTVPSMRTRRAWVWCARVRSRPHEGQIPH